MRYKLTIAYEGTHYSGWQVQPNAITIQALIQDALATLLHIPTHVTASGRTDAGVHAHAQVAHFDTPDTLNCLKTQRSLNGLLPCDIRITTLQAVPETFHARFSARAKTYYYNLSLGDTPDPFMRFFATHLYRPLNLAKVQEAASHFLGTHDFTSFANEANSGAAAKNPVRTLSAFDVNETPTGVRIEVTGNGFLYKMVRNMVGALIAVGTGKLEPSDIPRLLKVRDRRQAPLAAPARGLFLHRVEYAGVNDNDFDRIDEPSRCGGMVDAADSKSALGN